MKLKIDVLVLALFPLSPPERREVEKKVRYYHIVRVAGKTSLLHGKVSGKPGTGRKIKRAKIANKRQ